MSLSRRALLAVVGGAAGPVLAGCAGPRRRPGPQPGPATASGSPLSLTVPAPLPPVGGASLASPAPVPGTLTRDDIVARYHNARPTAWGLAVPGVTTTLPASGRVIALTFDACGGPGGNGYDQPLIDFLRRRQVPATLFLNARWVDANIQVFHDLAADPLFEIANHGTLHRPLSVSGRSAYGIAGTHDVGEVFDEVAGNRDKLDALLGHPPRVFRSGTAHCDDVATRIVADLGERVVNFDVNGDAGATFTPEQVTRAVLRAGPGSIVIGHMNHPRSGTSQGMAAAIPRLAETGFRFVRLSDDQR